MVAWSHNTPSLCGVRGIGWQFVFSWLRYFPESVALTINSMISPSNDLSIEWSVHRCLNYRSIWYHAMQFIDACDRSIDTMWSLSSFDTMWLVHRCRISLYVIPCYAVQRCMWSVHRYHVISQSIDTVWSLSPSIPYDRSIDTWSVYLIPCDHFVDSPSWSIHIRGSTLDYDVRSLSLYYCISLWQWLQDRKFGYQNSRTSKL